MQMVSILSEGLKPMPLLLIFYMVDKTNGLGTAIYGNATYHIPAVIPVCNILQGVTVNDREILHLKAFNGINLTEHPLMCLPHAVVSCIFTAFREAANIAGAILRSPAESRVLREER